MITCKKEALRILKAKQHKEALTPDEQRNLRRAIRLLANGWAVPPVQPEPDDE